VPSTPSTVSTSTGQLAAAWRQRLHTGRSANKNEFLQSRSIAALLRNQTRLIDTILREIWEAAELPPEAALLAVGGYGRGQLFPYSDIDLLILIPREESPELGARIEHLIGLFWDSGLEVGHSVRTPSECVAEALKDVTVQTNLLEGKYLTGNRALAQQLLHTIHRSVDKASFFEAKVIEQQQRHARFDDTSSNLEPNLKESPGGLRDLQTILWLSHGCGLGNSWMALGRQGIITAKEARQIRRREAFLEEVRARLHFLANRREDRLLFDYQDAVAQQFGLVGTRSRRASEQLMERYYRTAKAVILFNEIVLQHLRHRILPKHTPILRPINTRFRAHDNLLEAIDENIFESEPSAILECFLVMAQHRDLEGMTAATLRALWRAKPHINAAFRRNEKNRLLFMEILRQPHGITHELRRMNRYGILGRYIPAFGRIMGQMQHDLFHVYTVDEHILMVVRNLRRFMVPEFAHEYPLCSKLIANFPRPELLFLAGLFHDIAKGRGGDHSTLGMIDALRFCKDHGLDRDDSALVAWLVEHHLEMSATAQKQDLSDPHVIQAFAEKMGDERHLIALYLLTVADVRGTSPKVWNAWKAKLLEDLFKATRRQLGGNAGSIDAQTQARQQEALQILRLYALGEHAHEDLWAKLDVGYFLRHDAQEIAWHTRLLCPHVNTAKPIVRSRLSPIGQGLQVLIYAPDRQDLFARICSFFERTDYNIVEAKITTTRHGYGLDSFLVLDEANRSAHYRDLISYVEYELTQQLEQGGALEPPIQGRISRHLKHFPIEPKVSLQPDEKEHYYVLSIVAGDRPGLLSRIARIFAAHGISLHTAKINTLGERAEDIFVITGSVLETQAERHRFEADLLGVLLAQ
jgi:[protein-PII] uridylyltransferase